MAKSHGLLRDELQAGSYALLVLSSADTKPDAPLHIYLGGDGRPWNGVRLATDPTARRLVAVELMVRDPAPAVYLGRPCYHRDTMPANCQADLWTGGRYSPAVLDAMVSGLRTLIRQRAAAEVVLIGYSGGGALAVLVAPRLADLAPVSVITVAANLDTEAWTSHHRVLPLSTSLNPALQPATGIAQTHFLGEQDTIVPPLTVAQYSHRHPRARFIYVEDFNHSCCWVEHWPAILSRALASNAGSPAEPAVQGAAAPSSRSSL